MPRASVSGSSAASSATRGKRSVDPSESVAAAAAATRGKRRRMGPPAQTPVEAPSASTDQLPIGSRVRLLRCLFEGREATISGLDGDGGYECVFGAPPVKVWVTTDAVEALDDDPLPAPTPIASTTPPPPRSISTRASRSGSRSERE